MELFTVPCFYLLEDQKMCQLNCAAIYIPPMSGDAVKIGNSKKNQHEKRLLIAFDTYF